MGKTRSSTNSEKESNINKILEINQEPMKVFILHKKLLIDSNDLNEIEFLKLRNPGTEKFSYYTFDKVNKEFFQLIQFNQPNRSFFIDEFVNSNGKIYLTQPFDIKFIFLYYIQKYAYNKAVAIDQIDDPEYNTIETLSKFADKMELEIICDVKDYSDDLFFVKYNQDKALAWLSLVTKKIANNIRSKNIHIGGSGAQSANYEKSSFLEEDKREEVILHYAWGMIGTYLSEKLHADLAEYMKIQIPKLVKENGDKTKKRKPVNEDDNEVNCKKVKVETIFSEQGSKPKEKLQTNKDKKLAKAASGTKNIMSFFKK